MRKKKRSRSRSRSRLRERFVDSFSSFLAIFGQKKRPHFPIRIVWPKNLAATYSPILLCIVPSAMRGLTSEFGMGSGVSLSLLPPSKNLSSY